MNNSDSKMYSKDDVSWVFIEILRCFELLNKLIHNNLIPNNSHLNIIGDMSVSINNNFSLLTLAKKCILYLTSLMLLI